MFCETSIEINQILPNNRKFHWKIADIKSHKINGDIFFAIAKKMSNFIKRYIKIENLSNKYRHNREFRQMI